jgi:hypothetical protein
MEHGQLAADVALQARGAQVATASQRYAEALAALAATAEDPRCVPSF